MKDKVLIFAVIVVAIIILGYIASISTQESSSAEDTQLTITEETPSITAEEIQDPIEQIRSLGSISKIDSIKGIITEINSENFMIQDSSGISTIKKSAATKYILHSDINTQIGESELLQGNLVTVVIAVDESTNEMTALSVVIEGKI